MKTQQTKDMEQALIRDVLRDLGKLLNRREGEQKIGTNLTKYIFKCPR